MTSNGGDGFSSTIGVGTTTDEPENSSTSSTGMVEPTTTEGETSTGGTSIGEEDTSSGDGPLISKCKGPEPECLIFISKEITSPDYGVNGADYFCNQVACEAGMCDGNFKPLLMQEDGFWAPIENFGGTFALPSGVSVAQGLGSLKSPTNLINEDQFGSVVDTGELVWTGYDPVDASHTCMLWTTQQGRATVGTVGGLGTNWYDFARVDCNDPRAGHTYCIELQA